MLSCSIIFVQLISEEDSKTTTKDLESHEEATLPKESMKAKLPVKLVPLRKSKTEILGARKKEFKVERISSRRGSDSKFETSYSSSSDRASRDYTNLRFQDPNFYESPKPLDLSKDASGSSEKPGGEFKTLKKELDIQEVLKRSESLSPRYEQEWEQLSRKFGSEENMIDIDKLSINSLTKSDKLGDNLDLEKYPRQSGQPKELTLSGGGSIFLKSNRSKDAVSSLDEELQNDIYGPTSTDDKNAGSSGDRPKSILREKPSEDGES